LGIGDSIDQTTADTPAHTPDIGYTCEKPSNLIIQQSIGKGITLLHRMHVRETTSHDVNVWMYVKSHTLSTSHDMLFECTWNATHCLLVTTCCLNVREMPHSVY